MLCRQVVIYMKRNKASIGVIMQGQHNSIYFTGCTGSLLLCMDFNCSEPGLLFVAVHEVLIVVASLVEHRL